MTKWLHGSLTDEIQKIAKDFLGREITTKELRLYPYLDYCLKNWGLMDRGKVSREEMEIFDSYDPSLIRREAYAITYISKEFYEFIHKILWLAYVHPSIKTEQT